MIYQRRFKLGKLYYKFIKGTQLEESGWRAEDIATLLESHGFIKLLTLQERDLKGQFIQGKAFYIECEGKAIGRRDFFKLLKEPIAQRNRELQTARAHALSLHTPIA